MTGRRGLIIAPFPNSAAASRHVWIGFDTSVPPRRGFWKVRACLGWDDLSTFAARSNTCSLSKLRKFSRRAQYWDRHFVFRNSGQRVLLDWDSDVPSNMFLEHV